MSLLGIDRDVWVAPMAGGPTTAELAIAAGRAGSLGFLAGGNRTAESLAEQAAAVTNAGVPFGVNLFAQWGTPIDATEFAAYARELQVEADPYGINLAELPLVEDDDHWQAKLDVVRAVRPLAVTFTFALPGPEVFADLQGRGIRVGQTVTNPIEAKAATDAGAQFLVAQSATAGGHFGTFTPGEDPPTRPLTQLIRDIAAVTPLPLIAAGGTATATDVRAALDAGAATVSAGTAFLLADEAGTSAAHRRALTSGEFTETALTRAFTGRPARSLRNGWVSRHPDAPTGYPAINRLTAELRRKAAAAVDTDRMHLWAGTGFASVQTGSAASILNALTP